MFYFFQQAISAQLVGMKNQEGLGVLGELIAAIICFPVISEADLTVVRYQKVYCSMK